MLMRAMAATGMERTTLISRLSFGLTSLVAGDLVPLPPIGAPRLQLISAQQTEDIAD